MARAEKLQEIGRYKVGTVARLTGLSTHLIRAWERRYGTVTPERSSAGTRLYTDEDVACLQLVKALVDFGEPVGSVASLPADVLRERLAHVSRRPSPKATTARAAASVRLALLSPELSVQIRANPTALAGVELATDAPTEDDLFSGLAGGGADAVVIALKSLRTDPLEAVDRCRELAPEAGITVLYDFAPRRLLAAIGERGCRLVRTPLRIGLLRRMLLLHPERRAALPLDGEPPQAPAAVALGTPAPANRFDDAQLAQLLEIHSSIACECPSHLARIVLELLAFERYSQRCLVEQPGDSDLHALLARGTGHARGQMEELLLRVCEHDGIPLAPSGSTNHESRRATQRKESTK